MKSPISFSSPVDVGVGRWLGKPSSKWQQWKWWPLLASQKKRRSQHDFSSHPRRDWCVPVRWCKNSNCIQQRTSGLQQSEWRLEREKDYDYRNRIKHLTIWTIWCPLSGWMCEVGMTAGGKMIKWFQGAWISCNHIITTEKCIFVPLVGLSFRFTPKLGEKCTQSAPQTLTGTYREEWRANLSAGPEWSVVTVELLLRLLAVVLMMSMRFRLLPTPDESKCEKALFRSDLWRVG